MTITTRSERKSRRLDALSKLNTGWGEGFGETRVEHSSHQWFKDKN